MEILAGIMNTVSSETGITLNAKDFRGRLRIQKTVYLLKAMGFEAVSDYDFNSYIRGPYSRDLAKHYYHLEENPKDIRFDLPSSYKKILYEALERGDDFIEAVATLDIIRRINPTSSVEEIKEFVSNRKPYLKDIIPEAWGFLNDHIRSSAT